jgi:putative restriction endonuclease
MRYWAGVTDNRWYRHLAAIPRLDEVNFWHPSGKAPFREGAEGMPFLFKLKSPNNHIAGGGFFIKYESLPLDVAWEAFGQKNGASSFEEFVGLINAARGNKGDLLRDIGCSILGEPFFLPREQWIPMGTEFSGNVVTGKFFETASFDGSALWKRVQTLLTAHAIPDRLVAERPAPYGSPTLVRPRRGQGTFRALVTNAYGRRCAITGESTLPVLEAAHIKPVASDGLHNTFNGLLLRSDFHKLFDLGLVTITPDYRVEVSNRIKEQWFNGKAYSRLHGEALKSLPHATEDRPRADLLRWHNENRYERGTALA